MADKTAGAKDTESVSKAHKPGNDVIARRLQAVKAAGNLTPKMQRGFDRLAASIANQ